MKLWLNTSHNKNGLDELREKIADESIFKIDFERIYNDLV